MAQQESQIRITEFNGIKRYTLNGRSHRDGGPAVERPDGTREWYAHGKLHREDNPAIEYPDGTSMWYCNGKFHREDGPAIEYSNGINEWWQNGDRVFDEFVPGRYALRGHQFVRHGNITRMRLYRGLYMDRGQLVNFESNENAYMFASRDPLIGLSYATCMIPNDGEEGQLYVFDVDPRIFLEMGQAGTTNKDDYFYKEAIYHHHLNVAIHMKFDVIAGNIGGIDGDEVIVRDPGMLRVVGAYSVHNNDPITFTPLMNFAEFGLDAQVASLPRKRLREIPLRGLHFVTKEWDEYLLRWMPSPEKAKLATEILIENINEYEKYRGPYEVEPDIIKEARQQILTNINLR